MYDFFINKEITSEDWRTIKKLFGQNISIRVPDCAATEPKGKQIIRIIRVCTRTCSYYSNTIDFSEIELVGEFVQVKEV